MIKDGEMLTFIKAAGEKGASLDDTRKYVRSIISLNHSSLQQKAKSICDAACEMCDDKDDRVRVFQALVEIASHNADEEVDSLLRDMINEASKSPMKPCVVVSTDDPKRLHVVSSSGEDVLPQRAPTLGDVAVGDTVLVDGAARFAHYKLEAFRRSGEVGAYVKHVDGFVEVMCNGESIICHAHPDVYGSELKRGDRILYDQRQRYAHAVLPPQRNGKLRFIDRSAIPCVKMTDVANPHPDLVWLMRRTRVMFERPELFVRHDVSPKTTLLMIGPPGCGKTWSIKAFLYEFVGMVQTATGSEANGSRVIRAKMSELLSMWLGESEKQIEAFFDDVLSLGSKPVPMADGSEAVLPVVAILEEADALANVRSDDGTGGCYSRIMTTLLQRLDDPVDELSKIPLVMISTTNKPGRIDAGMFRRLGGRVAHFGRLDPAQCEAVLRLKIRRKRVQGRKAELVKAVVDRFYADDECTLDIGLHPNGTLVRRRSDFATPALVDESVKAAVDDVMFASFDGDKNARLDADCLLQSMLRSADGIMHALSPYNVGDYVDIPKDRQVVSVAVR